MLFGQRKTFLFTDRMGNNKLYDAFAYDCRDGSKLFIPMLGNTDEVFCFRTIIPSSNRKPCQYLPRLIYRHFRQKQRKCSHRLVIDDTIERSVANTIFHILAQHISSVEIRVFCLKAILQLTES